jgi:hypothetical protein
MYPILIKQSESTAARRRVPIWLVDATDGISAETGVTGTPRISKNGGASASASATITQVDSTNMPGLYYLELTAGEVDTLGTIYISFKTAATAQWHGVAHVVAYDPYDSVRAGLTALPNAAAEAAGGLYTRGTGAGQINQSANGQVDVNVEQWRDSAPNVLVSGRVDASVGAMAADALTASALATSAVDEIVDQVWDELRSGHVGAGSFGEGVASVQGNVTGSVASVTGAVGSVTGAVASVTGDVGGNVVGSVASVTGAVGSVTGAVGSVTGSVGSVSGNVDGSVASVTGAVGSVTGSVGSVAAGGIDAAAIATNAIDADALASDAVDEIVDQVWDELRSGHVGAGSFGQGVASVQGNVTGSVASVTGAVGSVTGAVGSVTGDVGGNVVGSVASVTGAVGSVTGSVGGNVDGSTASVTGAVGSVTGAVGSVASGGITSGSFGAGAIDAAAIANAAIDAATFASGAIDAAALATDAVNEIVDQVWDEDIEAAHGGDASAGLLLRALGKGISDRTNNANLNALLGVGDTSGNDVPNQILAGDTLAELSQGIPAATPTLSAAMMLLYMALRNKRDVTASWDEIHNDAATVIAKAALSDDATTFTRAEMQSGP